MAPTNIFHLPSASSLLKRSCVASDGYVCYHIPIPAVIGIVFGCAFLVLVLGLTIFICVKMRRSRYVFFLPFNPPFCCGLLCTGFLGGRWVGVERGREKG